MAKETIATSSWGENTRSGESLYFNPETSIQNNVQAARELAYSFSDVMAYLNEGHSMPTGLVRRAGIVTLPTPLLSGNVKVDIESNGSEYSRITGVYIDVKTTEISKEQEEFVKRRVTDGLERITLALADSINRFVGSQTSGGLTKDYIKVDPKDIKVYVN